MPVAVARELPAFKRVAVVAERRMEPTTATARATCFQAGSGRCGSPCGADDGYRHECRYRWREPPASKRVAVVADRRREPTTATGMNAGTAGATYPLSSG